MNEVYFSRSARARFNKAFVKRLLWSAANSFALGGLYTGRLEEHWVHVERRPMPLPFLGEGFDGATIAQITDLHLSPIVRERYLMRFVEIVNDLGVDFVAVTGDLFTGSRTYARRVARLVGRLEPRVATLACLGNHDYGLWHPRGWGEDRGLADYLSDHLATVGVTVLNNRSRTFRRRGDVVQFAGVEDYWSDRYDPAKAFRHVLPDRPTIVLAHNPNAAPELASRGAQWVLSGHTHGKGTRKSKVHDALFPCKNRQFVGGQYSLGDGKYLYVNRGIGYSYRGAPKHYPEITLFTLTPAEAMSARHIA